MSRAPFQVGWRWAMAGSPGNRVFLCNSEHVSERAVISDKRVLLLFFLIAAETSVAFSEFTFVNPEITECRGLRVTGPRFGGFVV